MNDPARRLVLGAAAVAMVAAGLVGVTAAHADTVVVSTDTEDGARVAEELLWECNEDSTTTRKCTWSNITATLGDGEPEVLGDSGGARRFVNCGNGSLSQLVDWRRASGYAITVGKMVPFQEGLDGIFESFKASEASEAPELTGAFSGSRTFSGETTLEVPAGATGWVVHTEKRVFASGTLTVAAGDDSFVIKDIKVEGPYDQDAGVVATHTRPHTAEDTAICDEAPEPDGR